MKFLIGELSKIFGISTDTLRYYDKIGILKANINPNNNYRYYLLRDIEKLDLILGIKDLGVSLSKIKAAIEKEDLEEYKRLIEVQKLMINRKIESLKELKGRLNNSIDIINSVSNMKNEYNFDALQIYYKKFTLYSIDIKNMLSSAKNMRSDKNLNSEINILDSQYYMYIYNLVSNKEVIEDEQNIFIIENKVTKNLFSDIDKAGTIKYLKKTIEEKFISVDFYGTESAMKEYILKLNKYFNNGKDILVFVKFKFYLPRKKESEYFVNIDLTIID
ncbi:MAG: MerR family DNA-binding transcriptional regulator [Sarcina sp.]